MTNVDQRTVDGFGQEWQTFDHAGEKLDATARASVFNHYFATFPWGSLPPRAVGADIGCGSGRWATLVAPRVGTLHLIDASPLALNTARGNVSALNAVFHCASASDIPLPDKSLDFAYSLGVLHHVPDTEHALRHIATKLKPGAPFLIYLYYAFDNRPKWYAFLWRVSDRVRRIVSRRSAREKLAFSTLVAAAVYFPLARGIALARKLGLAASNAPLAFYADKPFYVMRTDAYDRFSTNLEQRFTRGEIESMLTRSGFDRVTFSDQEPYWCAVSYRRAN